MKKEANNVFCATRPCGHHAEADRAMGFCIFNQAAIAAIHARNTYGLKHVAVVDFEEKTFTSAHDDLASLPIEVINSI